MPTRVGGRSAHDGEDAGVVDADGERVLELFDAGHVAVEVALEQGVVGDDDALDEVVVHLVLLRFHLVGDLTDGWIAVDVGVRLVGEQIGDAVEVGLFADR